MTTFGITLVRDEEDIIAATVGHMLTQVDHVIAYDNGSRDDTPNILRSLGVEVIDDPDPAHYQSRKMSTLAATAARQGADWVVPFDADELWYSPFGRIGDVLGAIDDHAVVVAAIYDHCATGSDPEDDNPVTRMGWRRRQPSELHKVACRTVLPVTIGEGNHQAYYPEPRTVLGQRIIVRHFGYRTAEQTIRKVRNGAAALAATTLSADIGGHWRNYGLMSDDELRELFAEEHFIQDPASDPTLIYDPAPVVCASQL